MTELEHRAINVIICNPQTFAGRKLLGEPINVRRPVVFKPTYEPMDGALVENYYTVLVTPEMMKAMGREA